MLRASGLVKYFGGKRALGPVSFEIGRGESVGILGLNGVGKSTLLRIAATDLRPSAGALNLDGVDAVRDPHAVRAKIGFLPQVPPLYRDMAVAEFLRFAGRLRGMDPGALERRLPVVEELTHIREVRNEPVRHLSLGYRQRLGVAQAIVHDPALLILDEPTHGLDPAQVVEMRMLVRDLKEHHTVLVSSHNLPEISQSCDRLLVLDAGRVIAHGTEQELSAHLLGSRRIEVAVRAPAVPAGEGAPANAAARGGDVGDRHLGDSPDQSLASTPGDERAETTRRDLGDAARASFDDAVTACLRVVPGVRGVAPAGGAAADESVRAFTVEAADDLRPEVCRALVLAGYDVVRLDQSREELETIFLELLQESARDLDHIPA